MELTPGRELTEPGEKRGVGEEEGATFFAGGITGASTCDGEISAAPSGTKRSWLDLIISGGERERERTIVQGITWRHRRQKFGRKSTEVIGDSHAAVG